MPADPFVEAAAGGAPLRTKDLLELAGWVAQLASQAAHEGATAVKRITP